MKKKSTLYIPPYKVSGEAVNLIAEIAAAIMGNTLMEAQVTAILAGKRVSGPQES